jgi:hypothetical protein
MSEIELKPCPFCGTAARLYSEEEWVSPAAICCENESCFAQPEISLSGDVTDLAKKWNTRAGVDDETLEAVWKALENENEAGVELLAALQSHKARLELVTALEEKNKLVTAELRELRAENERLRKQLAEEERRVCVWCLWSPPVRR